MKNASFIAILVFLLFPLGQIQAQSDSLLLQQKVIVKMKNGEKLEGVLIDKNKQVTRLQTANGTFNLISGNIKKIEEDNYPGMYKYANPYDTRYFVAPSAIPLRKGKSYYGNFLLTTSTVNYGITDNISVGGGAELISTLINAAPLWTLNTKAGFWLSEKIHVAGGLSWASITRRREETVTEPLFFIPYFVTTFGYSESNLSIGFSYNSRDSEYLNTEGIMFSFSGVRRLSNIFSIMVENHVNLNDGDTSFSGVYGLQLHFKKGAFQLGLILPDSFSSFSNIWTPFLGGSLQF